MQNNISTIFGSQLLTISKVHNDTGISRSTLTALYYRKAVTVKLSTLIKLCDYLEIPLSELIEYVPEHKVSEVK